MNTDLRVIDADTHLTEPHDLWTSRAPAAAGPGLAALRPDDRRKVLHDNAAALYNIG
jgi:predicted TIM-barrel fold metal-dependent hydrolase